MTLKDHRVKFDHVAHLHNFSVLYISNCTDHLGLNNSQDKKFE